MSKFYGEGSRYLVGGNFYDAKGRMIGVGSLKAKKAAQKERTELMKTAKEKGYNVKRNTKTSTLRQMANGTYLSRAERKERRIAYRRDVLKISTNKR